MKCKAEKYVQKKRSQKTTCNAQAKYGCLCQFHARQVAGTPHGFQRNRVVRLHLSKLTQQEIDEAIELYLIDNGKPISKPTSPYSYQEQVMDFVKEQDRTATEIVEHVNRIAKGKLSSASVAQLTRKMLAEGLIVRRKTSVNGKSATIYALYESKVGNDLITHELP